MTRFRPPLGPGVRLDTHVEDGYRVPPHYDSLLGKLVVWDETRPQAIDRMLRALGELVLEGVPTTRELAIDILRSEEFASGRYSTGYLAEAAAAAAGDRGLVTEPLVFRGPEGSITLTAAALTELVASAARSVDGVRLRRPRRAVEVRHADGRASVSLELGATHGRAAARLARRGAGAGRRGAGAGLRPRGRARGRRDRGDRLMAGRRAARRTALVLLYQWDVTGQELASLFEGEIDPFSRELAEAVVAEHEQLDTRITAAADEWTADRLGALERNILRMAILELDRGEVPPEVAIDEAVTLAKRYSSEDAGRLVNGILGRIVKEAA